MERQLGHFLDIPMTFDGQTSKIVRIHGGNITKSEEKYRIE